MSVKAWQPSAATPATQSPFSIDQKILKQFIDLSKSEHLGDLSSAVPEDLQSSQSALMTLGKESWILSAADFSNEELIHLIRFFTLAEQQLEGWQAGAESPVIWLVKVLRQRRAAPDKELLLWIKANSDNRFLPNGAL